MIFFALVVVAILFGLPIFALVTALNTKTRMEGLAREVAELKARLAGGAGFTEPQPDAPTPPQPQPDAAETPPETADAAPPIGETPAPAPPPPAAPTPAGGMEQALGTRWMVWIGGVALALGGILLVRYSIEQGLLGPAVRIALGWLFAAALMATGEFARRKEFQSPVAGVKSAYIPGVLTAAGIMSGFATTLAAYALYEYLPPPFAMLMLAAWSLAALYASMLHGPKMAALGLVGSYVTPMLVSSDAPNAWALFLYLLFVTAASYVLARIKLWLWVAVTATAASVLWGILWCGDLYYEGDLYPFSLLILGLMALAYAFLSFDEVHVEERAQGMRGFLNGLDLPATGMLMMITFLAAPVVRIEGYTTESLILLGAVVAGLLGMAWRTRPLAGLTLWSTALFSWIYLTWHIPELLNEGIGPLDGFLNLEPLAPPGLWEFLVAGIVFGGFFFAAGFLMSLDERSHRFWTIAAAVTPVLLFGYAYLRATNFEHHLPFGVAGLGIAFAYVTASEAMFRRAEEFVWTWRSGVYAASAVVALALALTIFLEKGWLTIALALICPGLAWVASRRPAPSLRYLAAAMAAVVIARLVWDPLIIGDQVGTTPILNWLLYGYGVPAIAFFTSAWMFRKQSREDIAVSALEAAGLLCTVVLIGLQIRHALNNGQVYATRMNLTELSIHTISWLGLAIGLQRIYSHVQRPLIELAATILGVVGLIAVLLGHLLLKNPYLTAEPILGNRIFNTLILAYLVPAILCGILFLVSRERRHEIFVAVSGGAALLLMLAYATLETRALFQGNNIAYYQTTSDAEWYAYSAVWLVYGVALLAAGIVTRIPALRWASLAVLLLAVFKVFILDVMNLSGLLRSVSVIGLGIVLLGIGYFYQRFVFPLAKPQAPAPETT